ncbi:MAG: selenocysteine-specific translation elongation factor [bacterium]|nr:selenocysteine-specific translation elongation factor [bacterium]
MSRAHPGLLRPSQNPEVLMMICTAGHVDHGKTRLVKLLTGCETDRLKVEQERGLTIELGFAPCTLGGDLCVGIVDVPGHEKFVKNMVAGVSGIDMAVLVIAADDGIMPQTLEHMQIMQLLGVRHGIVALTKTDLVDEARVEENVTAIGGFLKGTFMEGAPICPVSSETGDGFFDFYEVLVREIKSLARRERHGVFRMPIERVFVKKGFGTVATGIPVDGLVRVGDQVELVPGGQTSRIRGLQRFLRDADEGGYGQCLALNMTDFAKAPPERGQVLIHAGYLSPSTIFHVQLRPVPGLEHPLQNAESVKLHAGTSETPAKVYLCGDKTLSNHSTGFATLVTSDPVAAAVHDRFIIRRASPATTVAGGEILAVTHGKNRPRQKQVEALLEGYRAHLGDADPASLEGIARRVTWTLLHDHPLGATAEQIAQTIQIDLDTVMRQVAALAADGAVMAVQPDYFMHGDSYAECLHRAEARVTEAAEQDDALSLTFGDLRKGLDWPGPVWDRIQKDLEEKRLFRVRGGKLVLRGAPDRFTESQRALMKQILDLYERTEFQSPRPEEVPDALEAPAGDVARLMEHLYNEGDLVRLAKNVVLSYNAFRRAQDIVIQQVQERNVVDSADFKVAIGSTRKYALAILDFMDGKHITVRTGNLRRLAPHYERNLL